MSSMHGQLLLLLLPFFFEENCAKSPLTATFGNQTNMNVDFQFLSRVKSVEIVNSFSHDSPDSFSSSSRETAANLAERLLF